MVKRFKSNFFVGTEVERTPALGQKTLFVTVGSVTVEQILAEASRQQVKHIYLGCEQSVDITTLNCNYYDDIVCGCLEEDYWVTLDFDIRYYEEVLRAPYMEYDKFIPHISVKLPNIALLNANAVIKIDDTSWGDTNEGVWCHSLYDIKNPAKLTKWQDYAEDTEI